MKTSEHCSSAESVEGDLRYFGQVGSPSDWRVMGAVERLVRAARNP
jgi:hypothetical protein